MIRTSNWMGQEDEKSLHKPKHSQESCLCYIWLHIRLKNSDFFARNFTIHIPRRNEFSAETEHKCNVVNRF